MDRPLFDRILDRLRLRPSTGLDGLARAYRAWCERVPFDNVRKMIALRRGEAGALPGLDPEEFFEAWLRHGTGGTCWPTSRALQWFLVRCGFDARLLAASMRDLGPRNHGTGAVRIDGADWLVDSSLLTNAPLPLGEGPFVHDDPVVPCEIEREDGSHVLWTTTLPNPAFYPCRIFHDEPAAGLWPEAWEASRLKSPFNQRLYVRRNRPGEVRILAGTTLHLRSAQGILSRELAPGELLAAMKDDFGFSAAIVDEWVAVGGLADSLEPPAAPPPPPADRRRPSER